MDMEERYRLIVSTILNVIGCGVEVERMLAGGRIDMVAWASRYVYVMELKLRNNGGVNAVVRQIVENGCMEPFEGDVRKVVGLAIELDEPGKGVTDWQTVE